MPSKSSPLNTKLRCPYLPSKYWPTCWNLFTSTENWKGDLLIKEDLLPEEEIHVHSPRVCDMQTKGKIETKHSIALMLGNGKWSTATLGDHRQCSLEEPDDSTKSLPNKELHFSDSTMKGSPTYRDTKTSAIALTNNTEASYTICKALLNQI